MRGQGKLDYFFDIVSVTAVALIAYPFLRAAGSMDSGHLAHGLGIILADMITKIIKRAGRNCDVAALKRPPGATDCDIMCRGGNAVGRPGMPSGHAAIAAYFAFYFLWYELKGKLRSPTSWVPLLIFSLIVIARVYKRCHTLAQVAFGTLIGASVAMGVLHFT